MKPSDALRALTSITFNPVAKSTQTSLVLSNFSRLKQVSPPSLGQDVEVEGYVVHVSSRIGGDDKDVHFCLSEAKSQTKSFVVCEIQNATQAQKGMLDKAKAQGLVVRANGPLRLFLEHISGGTANFVTHLFEIHPVHSASVGVQKIGNITMDSPDRQAFASNSSVHEMQILSKTSVWFKEKSKSITVNESVKAKYSPTSRTLTFSSIPMGHGTRGVVHNYVYMKGYFSKKQSSFQNGKPYTFELLTPNKSNRITSIVIPDTPAYKDASKFHNSPPSRVMTAVGLRSLDLQSLWQNKYETVLCPVYRFA